MSPKVRQIRVEEAVGDLFRWAPENHGLAHCVGADFRMGGGVAVDFRQKFGNVTYLLQQGKVPGEVAVLPPEVCGRSAPVFYLVTKERSTDHSPTWESFVLSVQELRRLCEELHVQHLSMPRIGAGLDHLPWDQVFNLLCEEFQKTRISVTVFNYKRPNLRCPFPSVSGPQPLYQGFQLIGDSNMVRFAVHHGTYQQQPRDRYPRELGLCVSGQTVSGLLLQLRKYDDLMPNVVCLIGTNNVLSLMRTQQWKRIMQFSCRGRFFNLAKHLEKRCQRVIFVTVPPIPAHPECQKFIENINQLIHGLASDKTKVVNWWKKFMLPNGKIDQSLFEAVMGPPGHQRQDLIHLNSLGQRLLKDCLDEVINSF